MLIEGVIEQDNNNYYFVSKEKKELLINYEYDKNDSNRVIFDEEINEYIYIYDYIKKIKKYIFKFKEKETQNERVELIIECMEYMYKYWYLMDNKRFKKTFLLKIIEWSEEIDKIDLKSNLEKFYPEINVENLLNILLVDSYILNKLSYDDIVNMNIHSYDYAYRLYEKMINIKITEEEFINFVETYKNIVMNEEYMHLFLELLCYKTLRNDEFNYKKSIQKIFPNIDPEKMRKKYYKIYTKNNCYFEIKDVNIN